MDKLIEQHREILNQLDELMAAKGSVTVVEVTNEIIELGDSYSAMLSLCQSKL